MRCPKCGGRTMTFDSRKCKLNFVHRRRFCTDCLYRFTTYEFMPEDIGMIAKFLFARAASERVKKASEDAINEAINSVHADGKLIIKYFREGQQKCKV